MVRRGVGRLPGKVQSRADVGVKPLSLPPKPERSLPCRYDVQAGDVPLVMLNAAEVATVYEGVLEAVSM